jgi:hypothetical protein
LHQESKKHIAALEARITTFARDPSATTDIFIPNSAQKAAQKDALASLAQFVMMKLSSILPPAALAQLLSPTMLYSLIICHDQVASLRSGGNRSRLQPKAVGTMNEQVTSLLSGKKGAILLDGAQCHLLKGVKLTNILFATSEIERPVLLSACISKVDPNSEDLVSYIKEALTQHNIPLDDVLAVNSDNASVNKRAIKTLLGKPWVKCLSHSLTLVLEGMSKHFNLANIVSTQAYNTFRGGGSNKNLQLLVREGIELNKIRTHENRWGSVIACIQYLLTKVDALERAMAALKQKKGKAKNIVEHTALPLPTTNLEQLELTTTPSMTPIQAPLGRPALDLPSIVPLDESMSADHDSVPTDDALVYLEAASEDGFRRHPTIDYAALNKTGTTTLTSKAQQNGKGTRARVNSGKRASLPAATTPLLAVSSTAPTAPSSLPASPTYCELKGHLLITDPKKIISSALLRVELYLVTQLAYDYNTYAQAAGADIRAIDPAMHSKVVEMGEHMQILRRSPDEVTNAVLAAFKRAKLMEPSKDQVTEHEAYTELIHTYTLKCTSAITAGCNSYDDHVVPTLPWLKLRKLLSPKTMCLPAGMPSDKVLPKEEFEVDNLSLDDETTSLDTFRERQKFTTFIRDGLSEEHRKMDIVSFWSDRRNDYPRLSTFALKVASVPVSSVAVERSFALMRCMENSKRMSMKPMAFLMELYARMNSFIVDRGILTSIDNLMALGVVGGSERMQRQVKDAIAAMKARDSLLDSTNALQSSRSRLMEVNDDDSDDDGGKVVVNLGDETNLCFFGA